jgi:hypothetical protein
VRYYLASFLGWTVLVSMAMAQPGVTQPTTPQRGRGTFSTQPPPGAIRSEGTTLPESASGPLRGMRGGLGSLPEPGTAGKLVTLEVLIADVASSSEKPTAAGLLALEKAGKLGESVRLRLTSIENLPGFVQFGETTPRISGRAATGLTVTPIYQDINVGTIMQATSRVGEDGSALVQLYVERSGLSKVAPGDGANIDQLERQSIMKVTTQTTVRAKLGEPLLIGTGPSSTATTVQTWIVLLVNAS